jgi:tRNA pseudouridine32 synthase/23S rRNA pseudouridine746 synthase/23S rRNA pseudouridine1911/1915/1917 synthase
MTTWDWHHIRGTTGIFEDDAVLALNKPAGLAVTGERNDVDLVELAQAAGERLFPVHRIDKVTSGVVLLAKTLAVHGDLTRQFHGRTVDKIYLAVTTAGLPRRGEVELPLSVGRKSRVRVAAPRERIRAEIGADRGRWWVAADDVLPTRTYPSTTRFETLWSDGERSLLAVVPVTGRRHQIRVHLAWIGHQVLGDPLFHRAGQPVVGRTLLHSWRLGLAAAWLPAGRLELAAEPDADFWAPLADRLPPARVAELLDKLTASAQAESG